MELLYYLKDINTERKYVKSKTFKFRVTFIPPSPSTKSRA